MCVCVCVCVGGGGGGGAGVQKARRPYGQAGLSEQPSCNIKAIYIYMKQNLYIT